jgi:hypothetical protein
MAHGHAVVHRWQCGVPGPQAGRAGVAQAALQQLLERVTEWIGRSLGARQAVTGGLVLWDTAMLSDAERDEYVATLDRFKTFLDAITLYNTPARFKNFKFTRIQIFKLWGELFYWALVIINLKPAFNNPRITKYEAFHQKKPDLRMIRLLPIFSVLYVHRHAANDELNSQHDFWQLGLYVGPLSSVPGAIRAAVLINKRLHIITTTAIKGVSDGGHVVIYPTMYLTPAKMTPSRSCSSQEVLTLGLC